MGFWGKITSLVPGLRPSASVVTDAQRHFQQTPYKATNPTRRANAFKATFGGSADADILPSLSVLRARSRQLLRDSALAVGAINTLCVNVVGTGLMCRPKIDYETLGLTEKQAEQLEYQMLREWELFAYSTECDLERSLDFCGLQRLAYRSHKENGDVLTALPMITRPGAIYSTRIQLVEADQVSNPFDRLNDPRFIEGVELDVNNAPVAYHVRRRHPGSINLFIGDVNIWDRMVAFGYTTGRRLCWLMMNKDRIGQHRGVPYLASVMEQLDQLDTYTDAELRAAVVGGLFTVFVTSPNGDGMRPIASMPFSETGLGEVMRTQSDIGLDYGSLVDLDPGEDVKVATPGRPNQAFGPFIQAVVQQLGAATNIPSEMLLKRFEASYSASRAALLEAAKYFRVEQDGFGTGFCQPVYEAVMWEAVYKGRLQLPGFSSSALVRKAYLGADWIGPSGGQIDPVKEVTAALMRVEGGLSTLEKETAELTGMHWRDVLRQRKIEIQAREDAGLPGETYVKSKPADTSNQGGQGGNPTDNTQGDQGGNGGQSSNGQ